jgi:hypothetical protein
MDPQVVLKARTAANNVRDWEVFPSEPPDLDTHMAPAARAVRGNSRDSIGKWVLEIRVVGYFEILRASDL